MSTNSNLTVLAACVASNTPAFLWGPPGVGKSAGLIAWADSMDMPCEVIIGSIREPADFSGLPIPNEDGSVSMAPPAWAVRLANSDPKRGALLVLDELPSSPPAVQAAMLRVIQERFVGDLQLPEHVRIIAAGNPTAQAADGWGLAAPVANRFIHLDWQPSVEDWTAGFLSGFGEDSAWPSIDRLVVTPDSSTVSITKSRVAGFVNARPNLAVKVPSDMDRAGRAWPSLRSWTNLSNVLAHLPLGNNSALLIAAKGAVGDEASAEFSAWLATADLPEPRRVLADPSLIDWSTERPDRALAVLFGVEAIWNYDRSVKVWDQAWAVLCAVAEARKVDVAAVIARRLFNSRPDSSFKVDVDELRKHFGRSFARTGAVLTAA